MGLADGRTRKKAATKQQKIALLVWLGIEVGTSLDNTALKDGLGRQTRDRLIE